MNQKMPALKWLVEVTEQKFHLCWYGQICEKKSCIHFQFF